MASITESLLTLPKLCILDVTDLSADIHVLKVRSPKDILKMKYILLLYPVVSKTYSTIAEVSSHIASEMQESESDIAEMHISGSDIRLQRVSPDSEKISADIVHLPTSKRKRKQRTQDLYTRVSTSKSVPTPKLCTYTHDRPVDHPKWLNEIYRSGKLYSSRTILQELDTDSRVVLRAKDMPNISSMFNL